MDDGQHILVIEDEPQIRRFLRATLTANGYALTEAGTAGEGLRAATAHLPDVVLLDLGLPDLDGLEVTQQLRAWTTVPIIVLSARGQEQDKVAALDAGADDYLTKPFGVGELLARIRVAARHAALTHNNDAPVTYTVGKLHIDLARRQVRVNDTDVHLTPIEFTLLATLVRHAGKVVTHRHLLQAAWGPAYATETHYLRVYMGQLRHKLEADPARPQYLITEPGIGYRLRSE